MSAVDDFPVNLAVDASFWPQLGARLPGPAAGQPHPKHGLPPTIALTKLSKRGNGQKYGIPLLEIPHKPSGLLNPRIGQNEIS